MASFFGCIVSFGAEAVLYGLFWWYLWSPLMSVLMEAWRKENIYSAPISIFIPMWTNHCSSMMEGVQYKRLAIIELTVPLHCSMISDLQTWSPLLKVRPLSAAVAASALEPLVDHLLDQVVSVPASKATLFLSRTRNSWGKKLIDVSSPTGWVIVSTWLLRTSSARRAFWRASTWDTVGSASGSVLTVLSTLSFPDHLVFPRPHGHQSPLLFFPSSWSFGQTTNYCSGTNGDLFLRPSCHQGKWPIRYNVLNFALDKISLPHLLLGPPLNGTAGPQESTFSGQAVCKLCLVLFLPGQLAVGNTPWNYRCKKW